MKPLAHSATYVESTATEIHEIIATLVHDLGASMVQTMAGTKDATAPHRWAHPGGTGPKFVEEQRLRLGYRVWLSLVPQREVREAAEWLGAANHELNGQSPTIFIQQLHTREIVALAEAFAADLTGSRSLA